MLLPADAEGRIPEMSREIKFRVWCEYEIEGQLHKEMCGPENWFLLTQTGHLMSHGPMSFNPNAEKDYKVIIPEFFTGLLDKNGKEIYEGDIVRGIWQVNHKDVREGVVNYWEKFGLYGLNDNSSLVSIVWSGCEVIGNIHENPELLNV